MQVRSRLALIISALTLGACGTETPTSPPAASLSVTTVKTIGVVRPAFPSSGILSGTPCPQARR